MPNIAELLNTFFVNAADISIPGEVVPHTSSGNKVTPLVDGHNYFGALRAEIKSLKSSSGLNKFFYFSNWWVSLAAVPGVSVSAGQSTTTIWKAALDPLESFKLDDGSGISFPDFVDELADMSANNIDVRALLWVNPLILNYQTVAEMSQMYLVNYSNLLSADLLRRKPNMGKKVCLNLIGHSLGAMHLKMLVCGDSNGARAFVSGIDFIPNRVDSQNHINSGKFGWHDIGAKVEGPAIKGIYAYYKQVWDEQISRNIETFNLAGECKVKSHEKDFEKVPDPNFPIDTPGKMHVQVLRTAPQMNFGLGGISTSIQLYFRSRLISGFQRKSWDSATNGIFEFRTALYKAIMGAKKYIYVEDQSFWGQPIMEWLRSRLHVEPELHLIMIHHPDPADKPNLGKNLSPLTATAINNYLGPAETNMNNQVAFYERIDEVIIHSKVWIIDDVFFIIGSANCSRRSLYTDGEISIGVIDEEDSKMAIQFRKLLWGEHCGLFTDQDRAKLDNINLALKIWDESWGGGGNAPAALLPIFQRKHVPFEAGTGEGQWPNGVDTSVTAQQYDVSDADSRMEY